MTVTPFILDIDSVYLFNLLHAFLLVSGNESIFMCVCDALGVVCVITYHVYLVHNFCLQ